MNLPKSEEFATKAELIFNNFDLLCRIALFLDAEDLRCAKLIVRAMSIPLARQGDLSLVDALARRGPWADRSSRGERHTRCGGYIICCI